MGKIAFDVPQVREGGFYPQALEKGLRSERALKLALAEMYIKGVSTRKVAAITQQLCGFDVSSSQVSQATAALDGQLQAWRERPVGQIKYLYMDAHYEKVREDGQVRDAAVLKAAGVNMEGKREVLGVSVSLSEAEPHWRTILTSLNPGPQGRGTEHQRCPRRSGQCPSSCLRWCSMAEVPVSPAAECTGLRAQTGHEN